MKKYLVGLVLVFCSVVAFAQSAIIRGEVTPGTYTNLATTSDGKLIVADTGHYSGFTSLTSGAKTSTYTSPDLTPNYFINMVVVLDVTVVPGIDTVTLVIDNKDTISGKYYAACSSTAQVTTGTTVLRLGIYVAAAANTACNDILTPTTRVRVVHSGAGSFTYTVSYLYK